MTGAQFEMQVESVEEGVLLVEAAIQASRRGQVVAPSGCKPVAATATSPHARAIRPAHHRIYGRIQLDALSALRVTIQANGEAVITPEQ
jgi:hypothetical protein